MILLYNDPNDSFFNMYLKSMFSFFRKGFFIFLIINIHLSLWILNVISSFIIHEVIHLYLARKFTKNKTGYIAINKLHFFAVIPKQQSKLTSVLTYLSPSLMGVIFLALFISSSFKQFYYLPWAFNAINFMPFSADMRVLFRNLCK